MLSLGTVTPGRSPVAAVGRGPAAAAEQRGCADGVVRAVGDRETQLRRLARIPGIYVPRFRNVTSAHADFVRGYRLQGGAGRAGWEARTDRGDVETATVVIACGVWSPRIAAMAGARIPLTPAVHQMIDVGTCLEQRFLIPLRQAARHNHSACMAGTLEHSAFLSADGKNMAGDNNVFWCGVGRGSDFYS